MDEAKIYLNKINSNTILKGLKISYKWFYVNPFTLNNVDLGDLAALQAQIPLTATGYYLLDVGAKIDPLLEYMFNKGEIRLQTFKERNRIIKI